MRTIENISKRNLANVLVATASMAGLLALAGCGDEGAESVYSSEVTATYYPDGSRLVNHGDDYPTVLQYCDGGDLVSTSPVSDSYGDAGGIYERNTDHAACDDGVLLSEEFPEIAAVINQ